jgi:hypothetical protein
VSVMSQVLTEVRRGGSVDSIAARLGIPAHLAQAVVAELINQGRVTDACSQCTPAPACAACPLAPSRSPRARG